MTRFQFARPAVAVTMAVAISMSVQPARADWPQYLGPQRNGVGPDGEGLARSWPDGGPPVLWKVDLGIGYGAPAIHGDSVLILDRRDDKEDVLRRIKLADGTQVWESAYKAPGKLSHNGSRSTPATDGQLIFTVGPFGHIRGVRFDDGQKVWQAHLLSDWGAKLPGYGVSQSPLLLGDALVVAPWGKQAAVVAYNKKTGQVLWQTPNRHGVGMHYSSPVPMKLKDKTMILASGAEGFTIGVDSRTGKELWSVKPFRKCNAHIPSPTIVGRRHVLMTGGYGAGAVMFELKRGADRYEARELWRDKDLGGRIAQPLFYKGHVYGPGGDTGGFLRCVTPKGRFKWDTRNGPKFEMGSMIIVDGLIFVIHGRKGTLVMAEATTKGYRELGRGSILKPGEDWAPPAYSDGKLVIRDQTQLFCVDLKSVAR